MHRLTLNRRSGITNEKRDLNAPTSPTRSTTHGSPARRRKHKTLVPNRTPPLRTFIWADQAGNARSVSVHPPTRARLLGRRRGFDRLALTLHIFTVQVRRTVQDGVVLLPLVGQIRRLGRVARKLVHADGPTGLEIVLLVLGPTTLATRRTELVGHKEVKAGGSKTGPANDVDEVVVGEVHGAPVEHADVRPHIQRGSLPKVGDEEGAEGGPAGVEAWEGTKDEGGVGKDGLVAVVAKEGVDAGEAAGGAGYIVGCGGEAIDDFVPGGCAGNEDLDKDSGEAHVAKSLGPGLEGERGAEEPEEEGEDKRVGVVNDAVGEPGDDIEDGMGEAGKDV